ncbi:uncharacterized protein LOC110617027 [Manihot esculenta]|uniref:uncharacterized protein LOC110617027 n=1 Tax=Manihot esculenta TaxID=3983 RepID=UPI001CC5FF31|nr:uncharacterized protein LOC110617027 [Manihot esculenta]XP_043813227.1 uncharacterized protein LOC110617027 [Manihot esculenta]
MLDIRDCPQLKKRSENKKGEDWEFISHIQNIEVDRQTIQEEGRYLLDDEASAFMGSQEPAVNKLKEPILDEITAALVSRFELNFTRQDTASLWFLCKQVALLEWTDDLEVFILKGYGKSINYRMGVPLLEDVVQSMEQASKAHEGLKP